MTGAAVLRAGRTRAGLARSQGARGWARSQSRSVPPVPPPRASPAAAAAAVPPRQGSSPPPGGCGQGAGGRGDLWTLRGARVTSRVGGVACHQGHAGCTSEDAPRLRGERGQAGARPTPSRGPSPAPLSLRSYLTQPPLWSVLDANFMVQNLSAQVWKPDPQDWAGGHR